MQQAQVNLFADMGVQPLTLMTGLTLATESSDASAPTATVTSPANGTHIANGSSVTISGTASDVGGVVVGVEVSTDGGEAWHAASGTTAWSYNYVQHGKGNQTVKVRAIDDSANFPQQSTNVTYVVTGPFSVFGSQLPPVVDSGEPAPIELGMRFSPTVDGFVSGVRFYKSAANVGTHTGSLWRSNGTRLAQVTFSDETASGWQTAYFVSPQHVQAGSTYVVSYNAPVGRYAYAAEYWAYRGSTDGPLTVAGGYGAPEAGVYNENGGMPDASFAGTNYFVDAVFDTVDTSPLVATDHSPLEGATSVPTSSPVSAKLSRDATEVNITVTTAAGATIAGSTEYDPATRLAVFRATSQLPYATTFNATITAEDSRGEPLTAGSTWSFVSVAAPAGENVCPCSLFDESTTPETMQVGDSNAALTLGVKFTPTVAGTVSAVKFYKAPGNTGPHVGSLYTAGGALVASAVFHNESPSGWQTVTFDTPAQVNANTAYIASYSTTVGNYSVTGSGFAGPGFTRGPLRVGIGAGAYAYNDPFPGNPSSSNYLVDLAFSPAQTPLAITSQSPVAGAVDIARNSPVTVGFSVPIEPGVSVAVTSGGSSVAGSTALSGDRKTVVFTPTGDYPDHASVQVVLTGARVSGGTALPAETWTFTTLASSGGTAQTYSLFGSEVPVVASATDDSASVELGVSFTPSVAGQVTAIRFYKGPGNSGQHIGHLWAPDRTVLAQVPFSSESAGGWQVATLTTPITLVPGQQYVVSYLAPQGRYSYTSGYFSQPKTSGPLTAGVADNGRFVYASTGGYPDASWGGSNYFVDLVYSVTPTP